MPGVVLQPAPFIDTRSAKTAGCDVMRRQGGPRNTDWQASDADAIGICPVPAEGTVVDGGQAPLPMIAAHHRLRVTGGAEAALAPVSPSFGL